jgi:hypothetical protein
MLIEDSINLINKQSKLIMYILEEIREICLDNEISYIDLTESGMTGILRDNINEVNIIGLKFEGGVLTIDDENGTFDLGLTTFIEIKTYLELLYSVLDFGNFKSNS